MELIYKAGFASTALTPTYKSGDMGPLELTVSPTPTVTGNPGFDILPGSGAKFSVTRLVYDATADLGGATKDDCYYGAVVTGVPRDLLYFKVRATFELPEWKSNEPDYGWAVAIFVRRGDADYWPIRDDRVTVTLRSYVKNGSPVATLNIPGGTTMDQKEDLPPQVYADVFETKDAASSTFTLELVGDRLNRNDVDSRAGLEAFGGSHGSYRKHLWFHHPFMRLNLDPFYPKPPLPPQNQNIGSIGFAVAVARGQGTASVTIRDLSIYRLSFLEIWFMRFRAFVLSFVFGLGQRR